MAKIDWLEEIITLKILLAFNIGRYRHG